MNNHFVS